MKRKTPTVGKLKKKLWAIFSLYIKLKHSIDGKNTQCYTCSAPLQIGTMGCHGGHYWNRTYAHLMFDERNVRPQCVSCNTFKEGETQVFGRRLLVELGQDEMDDMYDTRKLIDKHPRSWYLEKIDYYTEEVSLLKERFGI